MPAVAKYNAGVNAKQQARILKVLWEEDVVAYVFALHGLKREKADLGNALDAIIRELQMPRSLESVGVGRENMDDIAESCLNDPWCKTNPVPLIDKTQVLEILAMVA